MSDKIHVVFAVYDPRGTFSCHAGVAMYSIFSNTKSPVCVHILHDDTLCKDNMEKFIELTEKFGQETNFIDVSEYIGKFPVDVEKLTRRYSRGSLFRLFIQDLLPVDKVIYLDCDVLVELDIRELWDVNLGDCEIGAVLDARNVRKGRTGFICRYTGIEPDKYFNSGVIVFDLIKIRGKNINIWAEALEYFRRYPYALSPDQDFLNKIFNKSMCELDRKFNTFGFAIDFSSVKGKLWHAKPWDPARISPNVVIYWRYLAMTPWSHDIVVDITEAWAKSQYTHHNSSHCIKRLLRGLKRKLSPRSVWLSYKIIVIWHDVIYRIRKKLNNK